jgi:hypothetical protein
MDCVVSQSISRGYRSSNGIFRASVLPRIDAPFLLSKLIEFAAETLCARSQSRLIRKNLSGGIPWFTFFVRSGRAR